MNTALMSKTCRNMGLLCLSVLFLIHPAVILAEQSPAFHFKSGLLLENAGIYGRRPIYTDAVVQKIITGDWQPPTEGQTLKLADGKEKTWKTIATDDEGWFSAEGRGGYIFATYTSDSDKIMLLRMMGNSMAYVNGVPRVGSRYQYQDENSPWEPNFDLIMLPVQLKKGVNEFLFKRTWRSGGRVKAELYEPKSDIVFNTAGMTLPDALVDEPVDTVGAVTIANCTTQVQDNLKLTVAWGKKKPKTISVPSIPPLSVRKVPFEIKHKAFSKAGSQSLQLTVGQNKRQVNDTVTLSIAVKQPTDMYKRTFISRIDGSVQYYAVRPAVPLSGDNENLGMVISAHGARVEAANQASSYAAKPWCNIVSPTNRGPYGFDWEDWGRTDLQEVMALARKEFKPDPRRIYLTGHSMGGHGTWINGATFPGQFAAIGPSAAWISFHSYRGAKKPEDASDMEKMLMRAETSSETLAMAKNLEHKGVYIIHGSADDNVRADQSTMMIEQLKPFHKDFVYYEEPDAGHWWDDGDTEGAECVDWPPLFDFFARHSLPADAEVRQVDFITANPGVVAWSHWAGIEAQTKALNQSKISIRCNPPERAFIGTTENVERLSLKLDYLPGNEDISVTLDGQTIANIACPKEKQIWLTKQQGKWQVSGPAAKNHKGPHRCGPFKMGFGNRMMFVYATDGNEAENAWAKTKARFDAEQWWYQGNGAVDIIPDTEFKASKEKDRGVVLYGNADTNRAWGQLLTDSPVQVTRKKVIISDREIAGSDLACLFLRPRKDSETACVAVVSGTGLVGQRLTERLAYLFAGCSFPDCIVMSSQMLTDGAKGVKAAGFFGNDWSTEKGEFVYDDAVKSKKLAAYIAADPRGFVMPRHYVCMKAEEALTIDGKLDEASWQKAAWTDPHVDIEGVMRPVKPYYETRTKMLWDDKYLYVAADMEDEHVWGTLTERNAVIFNDNDYEVFIDPDGDSHNYYEFEMNALNTVWNLHLTKPYKHAGQWKVREMPGQKSGVHVLGTLNDPTDIDKGWTVEIAFPWSAMTEYANATCPPVDGDQWRLGFSRVQWGHKIVDGKYVRYPDAKERTDNWHEENWVWSPQGAINMHRPETWGYVQFTTKPVGSNVKFIPDETIRARYLLHTILYAQEEYKMENERYAKTLDKLSGTELKHSSLAEPITMTSDTKTWQGTAKVKCSNGKIKTVRIQHDGRVWVD